MWILPKQLHTSVSALDTAALISDSAEQSQICELSLLARSKPSLARTWSQKWKRDSWTQLLSGRILKPSLGERFATEWASFLGVIPVSHSQQQASDSDEMTPDTSGLGLQMELELCDPESASSRTSRDTSASDLERSSKNWKDLVTLRRGEYSQRVKLAHLINASECSSWPTANARDWKDSINGTHPPSRPNLSEQTLGQAVSVAHGKDANWPTPCAMEAEKAGLFDKGQMGQSLSAMANRGELGLPAPANPSTGGNRQESWGTPAANDANKTPHCEVNSKQAGLAKSVGLELQRQWATPQAMDHINVIRRPEERSPAANKGGCKNLREEVHQWATPNTMDCLPSRSYEAMKQQATVGGRKNRSKPGNLREQIDPLMCQAYKDAQAEANQWATPRLGGEEKAETRLARGKDIGLHGQVGAMTNSAKLNPRWVETLMGLPIGWTMPSCMSPLTIAPTNCDCLETESCQQPQRELF